MFQNPEMTVTFPDSKIEKLSEKWHKFEGQTEKQTDLLTTETWEESSVDDVLSFS